MQRRHGLDNRGLEAGANPALGYGRFGRMFSALAPASQLSRAALADIAGAMLKEDVGKPITETESVDENPSIPAGYTYFGQFIDHDLTFDPTPLTESENDLAALEDFRTPALDLDCLYGSGPDDQPYLYKNLKFRVGEAVANGNAKFGTKADLSRLGGPEAEDRIALIGDKRNDENKIVSQLHGAFAAFHNKVIADDDLLRMIAGDGDLSNETIRFRAAATIVRWHYQWVVVHDYLERILAPYVLEDVLNRPGHIPRLPNYLKAAARSGYMPVEFSGAAFRFGHSMVRPSYALNALVGTGEKSRISTFSRDEDPFKNLNGFPGTLPKEFGIDWGYFFDALEPTVPDEAGRKFQVPQASYRIDALLVSPLSDLPEFRARTDPLVRNLAFRNLARGQMLGLPSGESVAEALGAPVLGPDLLWSAGSIMRSERPPGEEDKKELEEVEKKRGAVRERWIDDGSTLRGSTPLWYYVLREAEYYGVSNKPDDPGIAFGGQHLGPVGSRIVAETLIGLLWYDRGSFLHCMPRFTPFRAIAGGGPFTLDRLIAYALS
jgi:hypothetical protein